jgi:hypothetical protein
VKKIPVLRVLREWDAIPNESLGDVRRASSLLVADLGSFNLTSSSTVTSQPEA